MDWRLFFFLFAVWIILMVFVSLFFQWQKMNDRKYEEQFLKDENKKMQDAEPFEYRKHLHNYIVKVYDKDKINDLYDLGNVKYTSELLGIVGYECTMRVAEWLIEHPNVISIHEVPEGEFLNLDKVAGEEYVNYV